jgi:hypothetical protein
VWDKGLVSQRQLPVARLNEWYAHLLWRSRSKPRPRVRRLENMKWTSVRREVLYASSSKSASRANACPGAALGDEQEVNAGEAMDDAMDDQ